jgi:hypothetical protein
MGKFPNFGDVVDVADKVDVADGKNTKCTFDTTSSRLRRTPLF